MDGATNLREQARECERIAHLEQQQTRLDKLIIEEERRRQEIQHRLQQEIKRLEMLRKK